MTQTDADHVVLAHTAPRPAFDRPDLFGWAGHWPVLVVLLAVVSGWGVTRVQLTPGTALAVAATVPAALVADRWGCSR